MEFRTQVQLLFKEFLLRSAPFIDFLLIGIHAGAGWNYPSSNTSHGIQANRGLKDVEVKEIIAGISSLIYPVQLCISCTTMYILYNYSVSQ